MPKQSWWADFVSWLFAPPHTFQSVLQQVIVLLELEESQRANTRPVAVEQAGPSELPRQAQDGSG